MRFKVSLIVIQNEQGQDDVHDVHVQNAGPPPQSPSPVPSPPQSPPQHQGQDDVLDLHVHNAGPPPQSPSPPPRSPPQHQGQDDVLDLHVHNAGPPSLSPSPQPQSPPQHQGQDVSPGIHVHHAGPQPLSLSPRPHSPPHHQGQGDIPETHVHNAGPPPPHELEFAIRDQICIMKSRITKKTARIKVIKKKIFTENVGFQILAWWATVVKFVLDDLPLEADPLVVEPNGNDITRGMADLLGIDPEQLLVKLEDDDIFSFLGSRLRGLEVVRDATSVFVPIDRNPAIGENLRQLTHLKMELRALRVEQDTMENQLAASLS